MTKEEFIVDLTQHYGKMILEYEKAYNDKLEIDLKADLKDGRTIHITLGESK